MKHFIFTLALFIFTFISCKKETTGTSYVPNCSGVTKTFSADAHPVFNSSCVSCHSPNGGVFSLTTYSNIVANKSRIRSAIVSGNMPPSGNLTEAQKNAIVCWIDNGALNN